MISRNVCGREGTPQIEIILDGANSNTANIAQGYIAAITQRYSQRMSGGRITPLIDSRSRVWYNTELKSRNFIIPGLIAVIMAVIIALLTSLTIAREWDRGTMEQLISTPVKPVELVIGKLIPYFAHRFCRYGSCHPHEHRAFWRAPEGQCITAPRPLLHLSLRRFEPWHTYFHSGTESRPRRVRWPCSVPFCPAFLLSGFIFSISNMPVPLQIITYIVPARYFVTILKGIFPERFFAAISHLGNGTAHDLRSGRFPAGSKEVQKEDRLRCLNVSSSLSSRNSYRFSGTKGRSSFLFVVPVIQLLIFGYVATFDVNSISTAFYDLDKSSESRELERRLTASGYFAIRYRPSSAREITDLIHRGKALCAIQVNNGFSQGPEERYSDTDTGHCGRHGLEYGHDRHGLCKYHHCPICPGE